MSARSLPTLRPPSDPPARRLDEAVRAHHDNGLPTLDDLVDVLASLAGLLGGPHVHGAAHGALHPGLIGITDRDRAVVLDWPGLSEGMPLEAQAFGAPEAPRESMDAPVDPVPVDVYR